MDAKGLRRMTPSSVSPALCMEPIRFILLLIIVLSSSRSQTISTVVGQSQDLGGGCTWTGGGDGGPATSATLCIPRYVAFYNGSMYIADSGNNRIRAVNSLGHITTVAGSGPAMSSNDGTTIFSGDGVPATSALLGYPCSVVFTPGGVMYISDSYNYRIRAVDLHTGIIRTYAGNGPGDGSIGFLSEGYSGDGGPASLAQLSLPGEMVLDALNNLYFCDEGNSAIRVIAFDTGIIRTLFTECGGQSVQDPIGIVLSSGGQLYFSDCLLGIICAVTNGVANVVVELGYGTAVEGMAFNSGGDLYFANFANNILQKLSVTTGLVTVVAGTGVLGSTGNGGPAIAATMQPYAVAFDPIGNMYIVDAFGQSIRKVTLITYSISSTPSPSSHPTSPDATATRTKTSTTSGTQTVTATTTYTSTSTALWSISISSTISGAATSTITQTCSSTLTTSSTLTMSGSSLMSATCTASHTLSASATPSPSRSTSTTATSTRSSSSSLSFTSTASMTYTPSSSLTNSATSAHSGSSTCTLSPSLTLLQTETTTVTSSTSSTSLGTSSGSVTASLTGNPTPSGSGAQSSTTTSTVTLSSTASPSAAASRSPTESMTVSAATTSTATASQFASETQTLSVSPTRMPSSTQSHTASASAAAAVSPSLTESSSSTSLETLNVTASPPPSASMLSTATPSPSSSWSVSETVSPASLTNSGSSSRASVSPSATSSSSISPTALGSSSSSPRATSQRFSDSITSAVSLSFSGSASLTLSSAPSSSSSQQTPAAQSSFSTSPVNATMTVSASSASTTSCTATVSHTINNGTELSNTSAVVFDSVDSVHTTPSSFAIVGVVLVTVLPGIVCACIVGLVLCRWRSRSRRRSPLFSSKSLPVPTPLDHSTQLRDKQPSGQNSKMPSALPWSPLPLLPSSFALSGARTQAGDLLDSSRLSSRSVAENLAAEDSSFANPLFSPHRLSESTDSRARPPPVAVRPHHTASARRPLPPILFSDLVESGAVGCRSGTADVLPATSLRQLQLQSSQRQSASDATVDAPATTLAREQTARLTVAPPAIKEGTHLEDRFVYLGGHRLKVSKPSGLTKH